MYNEVLIECANYALFGLDDAAAGVVLGSIIGGIVNFVGSLINSNSTRKTNEKNIEVTQEENQIARDFEEEMYNKYESIPAQAQQYREAGLNPIQAVSPQSIGHASTSPIPQSQSPQYGNALIDSFPAFLEAGTTLRQQRIQRQQEISTELDNWRQAFENGNAEELYKLNKQEIESRVALTRADKKNREKELEQLDLTFRMAKEAYDSGINSFKDDHDVKTATIDSINATINHLNAQTDLTKEQKKGVEFANSLSQKFDEKFLQLDYNAREQQVNEYLNQSAKRQEMFDWSYDLAQRQYLIQTLQDQYDRDIWMAVTNLLKQGNSGSILKKCAAILSGYIARDPAGALNSISSLVDAVSPDLTVNNNSYTKNVIK